MAVERIIGPFFYINSQLISHTCSIGAGRIQADKVDNSYGHDRLFDDHFKTGDYIDHPRGRMVWNEDDKHAIFEIEECINKPK